MPTAGREVDRRRSAHTLETTEQQKGAVTWTNVKGGAGKVSRHRGLHTALFHSPSSEHSVTAMVTERAAVAACGGGGGPETGI